MLFLIDLSGDQSGQRGSIRVNHNIGSLHRLAAVRHSPFGSAHRQAKMRQQTRYPEALQNDLRESLTALQLCVMRQALRPMSVNTTVGKTAFVRNPFGPSSTARWRVTWSNAALLTLYAVWSGKQI